MKWLSIIQEIDIQRYDRFRLLILDAYQYLHFAYIFNELIKCTHIFMIQTSNECSVDDKTL